MRKILLAVLLMLPLGILDAFDYGQKIASSQSDVATGLNLPVLISSAAINFEAVTLSSPAPNSLIVFYKSTTSVFTTNLATWTKVNCDYQTVNTNPAAVPFFDMETSSPGAAYTYMQVIGNCSRTLWFRWISPLTSPDNPGLYNSFGIRQNGQR